MKKLCVTNFSHVHSRDHLFEYLFSWIDRAGVNFSVPLGNDVVKLPMISERSPLGVHDDMAGFVLGTVPQTNLEWSNAQVRRATKLRKLR